MKQRNEEIFSKFSNNNNKPADAPPTYPSLVSEQSISILKDDNRSKQLADVKS